MTSRERIRAAINFQETDKIPVDLGGCVTTGIHASALSDLREAYDLERKPIKIIDPMMMLGEVEEDMRQVIQSDVIGLNGPSNLLGYENNNWKPWNLPDGTEVLMGGNFQYTRDDNGSYYAYPGGNLNAPPSALMPANGFYFDNLIRQQDLTNHVYNAREDYKDQYPLFTDYECRYYEEKSKTLYNTTDYSIFGNYFLGGVGDIFHIPAAWLEYPKGIRDLEEWMIAVYTHPDYVKEFFDMQVEIQLKNLEMYKQAVGNRIDVIAISGTDFGGQNGLLLSKEMYKEFYKPYHKILNEWVHRNTDWKVFFHSCGDIVDLLDEFIDVGVDIINPVQVSMENMDPRKLINKYAGKIVFWGGGVDPQRTMPFGSTQDVINETEYNISIFSETNGYVCAAVHNIQANMPVQNIVSFFETVNNYKK